MSLFQSSQNGWINPFHPLAMNRDTFYQTSFLQAPSTPALDTSKGGAATASLRSLCQGIAILRGKIFFLISNLDVPSFS